MSFKDKLKILFSDKKYLISSALGLVFLGISFFVNYFAGLYATRLASNAVTDFFLDKLPVFDIDGFFIYGAIALLAGILFLVARRPEYFPFVAKTVALFVLTRSLFMAVTHLGIIPEGIPLPTDNPIRWITFGGDLFFSGHVGMPFLMALIFWRDKIVRYAFILISIVFGVVVLLGHFHYSIDVFAAYFITYGVMDIAKLFFAKDWLFVERFKLTKPSF
ncbi:sphingomyelin synthase family protein [Patescibacteria group bacterium]|nr:sphingomyelin synthase family protein [Patescibacteria group bacterium]MBU2220250.1 sphingomyelin synthase family protein [Patescibacteria group bacterium]MBU2264808.1 sphingomyelin synthase family protein [Patescibacteria group bacterium]